MLSSGRDYLERLRDGRVIYVGDERIADVTSHPAFRNAAHTIAAIYDMKADPANAETMSTMADGEPVAAYFLQARSRDDLRRRTGAHQRIADMTHGLFGRSPDHFASSITGLAMAPDVFTGARAYADNLLAYWRTMRRRDLFTAYAVLPPQAARDPVFYQQANQKAPTLQVVGETDAGIIISGMKMLATGAAYADDIWIGNIHPLAPEMAAQAVTCAVPCNAHGLSLWSRQPFTSADQPEADRPLAWRFDETDSMVLCDRVHVPWERVFLLDDARLSREIYTATPAHTYANHQSNVRFRAKLQLITGLASRVARANGADQIPAVREQLGRLAALEATLSGLIAGQIEGCEAWPDGFVTYNRRTMYAALNWCVEMHGPIIDMLRDLCGGGVLQIPASMNVSRDPALKKQFEEYWQTPQMTASDRLRLFKLAWDLVGSEFAGRHQQYEKFYVGPTFTVRAHNFREAPWDALHQIVDSIIM